MELVVTTPDGLEAATPLEFEGGLSRPVAVSGTFAVLVDQSTPAGTAWAVTSLAVPSADLSAALDAVGAAGEDALVALFGVAPEEPYLTWKNLWESAMPLPYRLGAVALALARRTGEIAGVR